MKTIASEGPQIFYLCLLCCGRRQFDISSISSIKQFIVFSGRQQTEWWREFSFTFDVRKKIISKRRWNSVVIYQAAQPLCKYPNIFPDL